MIAAGGYGTRDVAELIGFAPERIRHYVRRGLLTPRRGPHNEYRFSFQDVVLLRTAKGLVDARVSVRKAFGTLLKLKAELEEARPLTSMRICADGNSVVVQDEHAIWDAQTGQGHLDFSVRDLAGDVAELRGRMLDTHKDNRALDSDDWYNMGLDLEEVDLERAPEAYRRAIALDGANADAHVNLGRLYQLQGDIKRAKQQYQKAIAIAPRHQLALYNLGTLFDELDELETAVTYYRRAPAVPDSHYNLARIYELNGDELSALRHLRRYKQLKDS